MPSSNVWALHDGNKYFLNFDNCLRNAMIDERKLWNIRNECCSSTIKLKNSILPVKILSMRLLKRLRASHTSFNLWALGCATVKICIINILPLPHQWWLVTAIYQQSFIYLLKLCDHMSCSPFNFSHSIEVFCIKQRTFRCVDVSHSYNGIGVRVNSVDNMLVNTHTTLMIF